MFNLILIAAYSKPYETKTEAMQDWMAGKDFRIIGTSTYCSIRDTKVLAQRYNNLILSAADGGSRITISARKANPLDSML